MNLGEIAVTRIGKGREQRMPEIDLREQRVVLDGGFRRGKRGRLQQPAEDRRAGRGSQRQHHDPAVAGELARRGQRRVGGGFAEDEELRLLELISGNGVLATMDENLDVLMRGLGERAAQKIQRAVRVVIGIRPDKEHRKLRGMGRKNVERVVEGRVVAAQREGGRAGRWIGDADDARLAGGHVGVDGRSARGRTLPAKLELLVLGFGGVHHPHTQGNLFAGLVVFLALGKPLRRGVLMRLRGHRVDRHADAARPLVALKAIELRAFLHVAHDDDLALALQRFGGLVEDLDALQQRGIKPRGAPSGTERGETLERRGGTFVWRRLFPFLEAHDRVYLAVEGQHGDFIHQAARRASGPRFSRGRRPTTFPAACSRWYLPG